MKISGITPLRNVVGLGYPFEIAIRSLRPLCDEVVLLVDPSSEDGTVAKVRAAMPDARIVESIWDMTNHRGHGNSEISKQTAIACEHATGDWILSLQADELLHEDEAVATRREITLAEAEGFTALALERIYFYGGLDRYRDNWTVLCRRLFKRGHWAPDRFSGAMQFVPTTLGARSRTAEGVYIYHYSRVGDPAAVARRVRNLDTFYHDPAKVAADAAVPAYEFSTLRKLDTYVIDHSAEPDTAAQLLSFPLERHPASALAYFGVKP